MNAFCILSTLATLVVCCSSSPSPILSVHTALPHNLHHDRIGVQRVPVAPVHHGAAPSFAVAHHAATPSVTVKHYGTAPIPVAHHAAAHHAVAPVALSHHVPVGVAHTSHANVGVTYAAPAVLSHQAPAVAIGHHASPVAYVNSYNHVNHATPATSQYHSQDELGQYAFGYNNVNSARDESRDAYGNVRGSYSYVDSYGNLQTQHYIADDYGFRVTGTNLPVQVTDYGRRFKRSYATFPASTGPLTTVAHAAPVVHRVSPAVHNVGHVVHNAAPVHRVSHVVHNVGPVVHNVGPVAHTSPFDLGYHGIPRHGFSYHTGPSVTTYRNYNHPLLTHGALY